MSHRNAPLTPAGRMRLIERCADRPLAHIAAEAGVSRQCLSTVEGPVQPFRPGRAGGSVLGAGSLAAPDP